MNLRKLTEREQKRAAKEFAENWKNKGYEKGQSQPFWLDLLQNVYGVVNPAQTIVFEDRVALDHTSFIDGRIAETKVLIEQKSLGKDLDKAIKQSDGSYLNPFQQAKRYSIELPYSERPRWIVTSNFSEFRIYDMEMPNGDPEIIKLKDLAKEFYRMNFLVDVESENIRQEMEISIKAGEIVGNLYDALLKQYKNPTDPKTLKSLNILCVRLVFCLYAEDAGLFATHLAFHDYLLKHKDGARTALIKLFEILDTEVELRDEYEDEDLLDFPYVNGGLFADGKVVIPTINNEILDLILKDASEEFDWSTISPTIFGAVFESTLNPETRRSGGMHYTSIENIHKVIDPLFLDDLKAELERIKGLKDKRKKGKRLKEFQEKLASLTWLDPAAGSGNFLTETYICIRRLENEVIDLIHGGQGMLDVGGIIKVSIDQFNGIEINDFAVTVAKTALWIAESQMMKETEDLIHMDLDFLPLKTQANIVEGNALRIDWNEVVDKSRLNYILGNPPFLSNGGRVSKDQGSSLGIMSTAQKQERIDLFGKGANALDYVACWFKKASDFIEGTSITTAFVATNSICQGQQVKLLWESLFLKGIKINFAHQSFKWNSEATENATVFVVIVGFSYVKKNCLLFNEKVTRCDNINGYLKNAPNVFIGKRKKPLFDSPIMIKGSQPTDGGNLIVSVDEFEKLKSENPEVLPYLKQYLGGEELINNKTRYCLWLKDSPQKFLIGNKFIKNRLRMVKFFRENSTKEATRKWAQYPFLFTEDRQPSSSYIAIPEISSGNRRYIPITFLDASIVSSNKIQMIPNATIFHFGILTSIVHMAWMRDVCGYYGPSYDYSANIVYNNFPWPVVTEKQKANIEKTAQAILDARALYPEASLADLYNELAMPVQLRKAHQANDKAVLEAYGLHAQNITESKIVEELFKLYQIKVDEV